MSMHQVLNIPGTPLDLRITAGPRAFFLGDSISGDVPDTARLRPRLNTHTHTTPLGTF